MQLGSYLATRAIPHAEFARAINVTTTALYRYIDGDRVPRRDILAKIAEVTAGAVQPNDFFDFARPCTAKVA